jgi:hypothetical protein
MELPRLNVERKTGKEHFRTGNTDLDFTVLDFWQWTASDLVSNATRGLVAEFIVASALGLAARVRDEWQAYDLETIVLESFRAAKQDDEYDGWEAQDIIFARQPK